MKRTFSFQKKARITLCPGLKYHSANTTQRTLTWKRPSRTLWERFASLNPGSFCQWVHLCQLNINTVLLGNEQLIITQIKGLIKFLYRTSPSPKLGHKLYIFEGGKESLCHIVSGHPMYRKGENLHRVGGTACYHFIVFYLTRDGTIMVDSKKEEISCLCYQNTIIFRGSANKNSSMKPIFLIIVFTSMDVGLQEGQVS